MKPSPSSAYATLRSQLHQPPTPQAFGQLLNTLRHWPETDTEAQQLAIQYAQEHLQGWPESTRTTRQLDAWPRCPEAPAPPEFALVKCFEAYRLPLCLGAESTFASREGLGTLRSLRLQDCHLGDEGAKALAESPHLTHLKKLALVSNRIQEEGAYALSHSTSLRQLEVLDLGDNRLQNAGVQALAEESQLQALEELMLYANQLGPEAIVDLAKSPSFRRLKRLNIAINPTTDQAALALSHSTTLTALRSLSLGRNALTTAALNALASSKLALQHLELQMNSIDDLDALRYSQFDSLRWLDLSQNQLGAEAIAAFASESVLPSLRTLHLSGNQLTDEGVIALVESPLCRSLETLRLDRCQLTDEAAKAIAHSPHLGQLKKLSLQYNQLGEAGARAIAQSPQLTALEQLRISHNLIGPGGVSALAATSLPHLQEFQIEGNQIGDEGANAVAQAARQRPTQRWYVRDENIDTPGRLALWNTHTMPLRVRIQSFHQLPWKEIAMIAAAHGVSLYETKPTQGTQTTEPDKDRPLSRTALVERILEAEKAPS